MRDLDRRADVIVFQTMQCASSRQSLILCTREIPRPLSVYRIFNACGLPSKPIRSLTSTTRRHFSPPRRIQTSSHQSNVETSSEIFSYSSGRFLFNENLGLEERYVEFNVQELHAITQRSVGHAHGSVVRMNKLAEGGFNRVFLLQMEDGFELNAKIP